MPLFSATSPAPLLASTADDITLVFLGFGIVLSILGVLWLVTALIGRIFVAQAAKQSLTQPAATTPAPAPAEIDLSQPSSVGADPHLLAVVAAATQIALNRPVAIRSISPATRGNWAAEGRRAIHSSHRVR
ncbi:MAG: OadG family protein [Opitutales bacterium]